MKNIIKISLAAFLFLTLTNCSESENIIPQTEEKACDESIDTTINNFKSSVLQNAPKIRSKSILNNYTRANICDKDNLIQNKEFEECLKPVLEKSKDLLNVYGITDEELKDIFSGDADANAIILAIAIAGTETGSPVTRSQIANCALDALGIPVSLICGSAKSLSKKAILKAATKLASKSIGWIGAAIAVVDFAACMDYI